MRRDAVRRPFQPILENARRIGQPAELLQDVCDIERYSRMIRVDRPCLLVVTHRTVDVTCVFAPIALGQQLVDRAAGRHAQAFDLSTAFSHPARSSATRARGIAGSKRRSTRQFARSASSLRQ